MSFDTFAAKLLDGHQRQTPGQALRLALLGPPGSGKAEVSHSIEHQLLERQESTRQFHVRMDAFELDGFEMDEAHFKLLSAIRTAVSGSTRLDSHVDVGGATVAFAAAVRKMLEQTDASFFVYLDRMECLHGNVIRSLGNSFREIIEAQGANFSPDRFHMIWSGNFSIFALRSVENSALGMCEPIIFPLLDSKLRKGIVSDYVRDSGLGLADGEVLDAIENATGAEPGFLELLSRKLGRYGQRRKPVSVRHVQWAVQAIVEQGWSVPELKRIASMVLTDGQLAQVCCSLLDGIPAFQEDQPADIHRNQMSGAIVVDYVSRRRRYLWRNGIVERFCQLILERTAVSYSKRLRGQAVVEPNKANPGILDLPDKIRDIIKIFQDASNSGMMCDAIKASWKVLSPYQTDVVTIMTAGDLHQDVAYVVAPSPEGTVERGNFSSILCTLIPSAWELCRGNLVVFTESQISIVALGLRVRSVDFVILLQVQRAAITKQVTEYHLEPWASLVRGCATKIAMVMSSAIGNALMRDTLTLQRKENIHPSKEASEAASQGAVSNAVELLFLRQEAALIKDGSTTPYYGTFEANWVQRVNEESLDLSRYIQTPKEYRKHLSMLSETMTQYLGKKWPGLDFALSSLEERVPLKISHSADLLRVPFELLRLGGSYLGLRNPVYRHIIDGDTRVPFDAMLSALVAQSTASRPEPFRAILVGPYRSEILERVKHEIIYTKSAISEWCERNGVPLEIEILDGLDATVASLEGVLERYSRVHLLHFCGHGSHNTLDPDSSSLAFVDKNGEFDYVNCRALRHILEDYRIWFVYLSCCYSGASSVSPEHYGSDFLGVAQAVVAARVSNVLSFRWQVSDTGAEQFAQHFYRRLFGEPPCSLADAVRDSRRKADGSVQSFDAWASPVLVANHK